MKPLEPWRLPSYPNHTDLILAEVAAAFGFVPQQLRERSRTARIAWARQVAMYLLVDIDGCPTNEAARLIGRDHGAVSHACRRVKDLISVHDLLAMEIGELRERIARKIQHA